MIGCGLLVFGVFAPALQLPFGGAMSHFALKCAIQAHVPFRGAAYFEFDAGWITLTIVAVALLAALTRVYSVLWLAGLASLGFDAWLFAKTYDGLGGAEFLAWGWPVLVAGAVALLVAAGMRRKDDPDRMLAWLRSKRLRATKTVHG